MKKVTHLGAIITIFVTLLLGASFGWAAKDCGSFLSNAESDSTLKLLLQGLVAELQLLAKESEDLKWSDYITPSAKKEKRIQELEKDLASKNQLLLQSVLSNHNGIYKFKSKLRGGLAYSNRLFIEVQDEGLFLTVGKGKENQSVKGSYILQDSMEFYVAYNKVEIKDIVFESEKNFSLGLMFKQNLNGLNETPFDVILKFKKGQLVGVELSNDPEKNTLGINYYIKGIVEKKLGLLTRQQLELWDARGE